MKYPIFLILLFLWAGKANAQFPYLRAINYPYQISAQNIYDIFTDSKGQIWLGSDKGLLLFNGKKAKEIPYIQSRQNDLTHLAEDKEGKIWGMNFANQIFYLQNDTLHSFPFPKDLVLEGNLLKFIVSDEALWLLTHKQVAAIHLKTQKVFFTFYSKEKYTDFLDLAFFKDKIHIVSPQKAYLLDEIGQMETWDIPIKSTCRFVQTQDVLLLAHRENIERKAAIFENNRWQALPDFRLDASITIFHYKATPDGNIWICTKQGGYLWDFRNGNTQLLFPDKQFTGIAKDYQGSYWISTLETGLWFCPSLGTNLHKPIAENLLEGSYINGIYATPAENVFWLTTTNGLIVESSLADTIQQKIWQSDFKKDITSLIFDKIHRKIISSAGIFSLNSRLFKPISAPKSAHLYQNEYLLSAQSFVAEWAMIEATLKDTLPQLFGAKLNSAKSKYFKYPIYTLRQQRAYSVCLDTIHKKYWVGFADDLYEYDFEGNSKVIRHNNKAIVARSMSTDTKGNLYIASFNQGLLVIADSQVKNYFGKNKLLKSNHCKQVLNYKDTIWVGTDVEIGYILPDLNYFYDILGNNSIGRVSYQRFLPTRNQLLVATTEGLLALNREKIVVLSTLRTRSPQIVQYKNNVQIHLEALNYKNPEHNRFYYRLAGIESAWNEANEVDFWVKYPYLAPQKYTFEFFAQDALSGAKSPVQQITFQIPKKWWQEFWFLAFCVLLAFGVSAWVFRWWLKRYQNKQKLKEDLWVSQLKAIKTQMNPHFLYNVLNTVQGLVYGNRKSEASDLLGNFSDLMRKMLESSEKPYISLKEELENLRLYLELEKIRFEDSSFHYAISSDIPNLQEYLIPSMLLQPFAENAIKHGLLHKKGDKKLLIQVEKYQEGIKIIIDDNGIGRKQAQDIRLRQQKKSTQFASSAIAQRIELINKMKKFEIDLQIIDKETHTGEPSGTNVEIIVKPA